MRYKVDLKKFMADCEANYHRLMVLFPDMAETGHYRFGLMGADDRVELRVLKRAPYTSLVEMTQNDGSETSWLASPTMRVCLYHDAAMAEVVACENVHGVHPRYHYPNTAMHQPDEKAQWNRFLSDWLATCLRRGYTVTRPFEFVDQEP